MPAASLKRHAPDAFDDVDTENIDPLTFSSPSKKSKTFDFELTKSEKTPLFNLTPARPSQYIERVKATPICRKLPLKNMRDAPASAPAPAGRSPTKIKKNGILSRRRTTATQFTRVNPPTFSVGESKVGLPFSIDAALAGTVPSFKSKSTHRKGWQFEIHEDSPDDEMANLMEHSTCTLDISDDESSPQKGDKDNKENVPPTDYTTQLSSSRRDMMTDEARSPLGDLEAKDFYAEGCDASSFIIVPAEDCSNEKTVGASKVEGSSLPSHSPSDAVATDTEQNFMLAELVAKTDASANQVDLSLEQDISDETSTFQIWESESAKGDNDVENLPSNAPVQDPHSMLA